MGGAARRQVGAAIASVVLILGATACQPLSSPGGERALLAEPASDQAQATARADWVVETPESHGMDPAVLEQARQYVMADGTNTQGLVIVHEGAIVAEWYAPGIDQSSPGTSWSVGKSITSSLIGIAIDEGLIPSIDEPMTTYFPEWVGTPKAAITLRHVLHMESGLDFVEEGTGVLPGPDIIDMVANHPDQLAFASSRPLEVPPGTRFQYSSGDTMLLSGVLEQATGMSAGDYARTKLFDPIGIGAADWWQDAEGHSLTYCCVDATARDFARFGQLYLDGGRWGSDQVVPASWVTDSWTDTATTNTGYGYQWWLDPATNGVPERSVAIGFDGQLIIVIPSLDLVVVRLGTYFKSPCPAVADPNLITYIPPLGLVPGKGTLPPESLDTLSAVEFLTFVVDSFAGGGAGTNDHGDRSSAQTAAAPTRAATDDCPNLAAAPTTTTTTTTVPPAVEPAAPAVPVGSTPTFTG